MLLAALGALDILCAINIIFNVKFFALYLFVALLIKGVYSIFSGMAGACCLTFFLGLIDFIVALCFIFEVMTFLIPSRIVGIVLFTKGLYSLLANFRS